MFCPYCGRQLPDDAKFCLNCGKSLSGDVSPKRDYEEDEFIEAEPARRPLWPWIITAVFAAVAVGVILYLLLGGSFGGTSAPIAAPTVPSSAPAQQATTPDPGTPSPVPAAELISPSPVPPTTEIIVITPAPPTASPTPSVPDAVKVFYMTKELDEFTEAQGNSILLNAQAYPIESFTNASFQWTVSDPSVLKLEPDAYGRTCTVTVLKVHSGPVTLTVSCCGAKKDVKVYTKSASAPSPKPGPVTLDKDTQYRINIFLSNFSEQFVLPFTSATCADDYLLRVVEIYCKINHPGLISYSGGDECLGLKDANTYMERFFGRTVNPPEGATYLLDASHSFRYSGGYFRFPAADGANYNRFTVVRSMTANTDGTYDVEFTVYEISLEQYWNTPGVDNSFYWLNDSQVSAKVWNHEALPVQNGTAIVKDYSFNGKPTYQILKYDAWDIEFSY
jgi:hypothetical protein